MRVVPALGILLLTGCPKASHPLELAEPPAAGADAGLGDDARVVVVRPGVMAFAVTFGIRVNGEDVGGIRSHDFVQAVVPAGVVTVEASAENRCTASFPVEAGHVYYVEAVPKMGWVYARVGLDVLDPDAGEQARLQCEDQSR